MPPMLVTLSIRRVLTGAEGGMETSAAAVFFLMIRQQHTLKAVRDTLMQVLGLAPSAELPLSFSGRLLEPESRTTEVRCLPA